METGFLPPNLCEHPYTISEINSGVSQTITEAGALVWVEAEVSSFKKHSSGHCYLRLKDSGSQIPAVIWRSNAEKISTPIEEGMLVVVIATIRVYERGGYYQLDIHKIAPSGEGDAALKLELLKAKLTKEGLFDEDRKRELPTAISTIAVITAKTGAAYHDIVNVIARNAPHINIILVPAVVQGDFAPPSLVKALDQINKYDKADLIIFGRGGGSSEDLSCFNDESVVRAVASSETPIISAVGHEIDFSLSDFAADLRAPTPSAAAEIAVASFVKEQSRYSQLCSHFSQISRMVLSEKFRVLDSTLHAYPFKQVINRFLDSRITLDNQSEKFSSLFSNTIKSKQDQLSHNSERLNSVSPLNILSRGYAVVNDAKGEQIKGIKSVNINDVVSVKMEQGRLEAKVLAVFEN
jgi:exodeoxyribonuclease VII large subunit